MDIRNGTALATAKKNETTILVYFQDVSGIIHEGIYSPSSGWSNGVRLVGAKLGTPIAAAHDAAKDIHIYYLTGGDYLTELVYHNNQWTVGDLGAYGFRLSPSTDICAQMRSQMISVYVQLADNTIQELTYRESKWTMARNFGRALFNTCIAIAQDVFTRLYYQSDTGDIIEKINTGNGWEDGTFTYADARPGTPITAISWNNSIRVYHIRRGNYLVQSSGTEGRWTHKCLDKQALEGSRLASRSSSNNIWVYLQDRADGDSITEIVYQNNTWHTNPSVLPASEAQVHSFGS